MPLQFKVDILETLKEKGYSSYTLRKENILSQSTIQKLREGKGLAWADLNEKEIYDYADTETEVKEKEI